MNTVALASSARREADVIIVGAGPAGIAALLPLLDAGRRVIWVDQSMRAGGQIWRAGLPKVWLRQLDTALRHPLLQTCFGCTVIAAEPRGQGAEALHGLRLQTPAATGSQALHVAAPQMLLALGGRERHLPFPGWTLPGVMGAGGLQALVKQGWPVAGQRVVLAGSGPLLLAAADTVRQAGAQVLLIAEQASRGQLIRFAASLNARKVTQAASLAWRLRDIPYQAGTWVQAAIGQDRLQSVQLIQGKARRELACDALGVGFGLLPNTELAQLLGCQLQSDGTIAVDEGMGSSVAGVYAAGECTGIGGVDKSLAEGALAAQSLLLQAPEAARARRQALRFARHLAIRFALRPELLQLADAQTLVCRCEDIRLGALRAHSDWRDAKLQTRCGMGACQGRICGPITESLLGWPAQQTRGLRAPLQPGRLGAFAED